VCKFDLKRATNLVFNTAYVSSSARFVSLRNIEGRRRVCLILDILKWFSTPAVLLPNIIQYVLVNLQSTGRSISIKDVGELIPDANVDKVICFVREHRGCVGVARTRQTNEDGIERDGLPDRLVVVENVGPESIIGLNEGLSLLGKEGRCFIQNVSDEPNSLEEGMSIGLDVDFAKDAARYETTTAACVLDDFLMLLGRFDEAGIEEGNVVVRLAVRSSVRAGSAHGCRGSGQAGYLTRLISAGMKLWSTFRV